VAGQEGPVAEFCAGLRRLLQVSGLDRAALARRVSYSRSQLYEILEGRIRRPPEWDRLVEPLVRACTGDDQREVALWRRRHDVLVAVYSDSPARAAKPAHRSGQGWGQRGWCRRSCRATWTFSPAGPKRWPNSTVS
jgi:hypothetical protein